MSRSVVVTGGSGFIGRPCIESLVADGADVVAVGRTDPGVEGVRFVSCDLTEPNARRRVFSSIRSEVLVHLAWYLEPGKYTSSPRNIDWLSGTLDLARSFAQSGGSRMVVTGTCFEYVWSEPVLSEGSPVGAETLYGTCKDLLHRSLTAYSEYGGPELAWARLFFLYGPRENEHRLAGAVASALLRGQEVATSEGTQRRDYMYVGDAGKAMARLATSSLTGPINIARGEAVQVREIIGGLAAAVGRPDLVKYGARPLPANEPEVVEADVDRLTGELGFGDFTDLNEGLARTIDWWRHHLGMS